jgi:predicted O-methyltransferase YrrM
VVWIDKIEELRRELNSSKDEVTLMDYGAVLPDTSSDGSKLHESKEIIKLIGDVSRTASKPYMWSFLLLKFIREFKPVVCLEMGTCLGISASYQAAALKLNGQGKIITLEGAESLAGLAEKNFQRLGLDNVSVVVGRFQNTLEDVLKDHGPIDYIFIDGHHQEEATLVYFRQALPFLSERSILVFDDISWSEGMKRAWSVIKNHERIKVCVDLVYVGICIVDPSVEQRTSWKIDIS